MLLAAAVLLATILPGAAPRSAGTALAQSGADPYIKDTVFDSGVEPNPDTGPMWESQDIWVRTTPDPNYSPLPFPLFEVDISKLVLVRPGSVWRYLDDHTTPAPGWTAPGFDDTKWKQGRGTLGFGDTQDTLIRAGPAGALHRTTYFRQTFSMADPTFYCRY